MQEPNENMNFFTMSQYAVFFEKAITYCAMLVVAILVGAVFTNGISWDLDELLNQFYIKIDGTGGVVEIYLIIAVLVTVPYFYAYALRNSLDWIKINHIGEDTGLIRFFCLYEISVMAIFYLSIGCSEITLVAKLSILLICIFIFLMYGYAGIEKSRSGIDLTGEKGVTNSIHLMLTVGGVLFICYLGRVNLDVLNQQKKVEGLKCFFELVFSMIVGYSLIHFGKEQEVSKKKNKNVLYLLGIICCIFWFYNFCLLFYIITKDLNEDINSIESFRNMLYVLSFQLNTLINLYMLFGAKYDERAGVCSNRVKIINFVLSIAAFPIISTYCFFSQMYWKYWILAILFLGSYEFAIFKIDLGEGVTKALVGTLISIAWLIIVPFFTLNSVPKGMHFRLRIYWIMLMGICVYMAAMKYWGYIFHIMKYEYKGLAIDSEEKQWMMYDMLVRFDVSFLGAMIFTVLLFLATNMFTILCIGIFAVFMIVNLFLQIKVLRTEKISLSNRERNIGVIIEFIGIIIPIICFVFDIKTGVKFIDILSEPVNSDGIKYMFNGIALAFLTIYLFFRNKSEGQKERNLVSGFIYFLDSLRKITSSSKMADRNKEENNLFYLLLEYSTDIYCISGVFIWFILCSYFPSVITYFGIMAIVFMVLINLLCITRTLEKYYLRRSESDHERSTGI